MRKIYTLLLFCYFSLNGYSQIISADTVCAGVAVDFTTPRWATTYAWDFSAMNVIQPISPVTTFYSGTPLSVCAQGVSLNDSGNYYYFTVNYTTQELIRFSFGSSIHNPPVVTDLGSFGMTGTDLNGLDIVKDSITNQWYGVMAEYSQLGLLSFGTSLAGTPACTITSFPSPAMDWAHQITLKRYNGNWIAFIANRHTNMTRLDFGPSLTGTPVATVLPNAGTLSTPVNFSLYEQSGNWYMLIANLLSNTIVRYNFGTNLLNNSPAGVSLGNPGGFLNLPRPINILNDCEGHLIAYVGNEDGELIKLDFGGDITSTPVATDMGSLGISHFADAAPCSYSDSFAFICTDAISNQLRFFNPLYFSTPTVINYYNPNETYTYSSMGTYPVSLFCDMGYNAGPVVYCKDIVVVPGIGTSSSRDTSVCLSYPLTLFAGVAGSHIWSTGDTASSISVSASGAYWVTTTTGACMYKSDTIHVVYTAGTPVNLGNDTAFCIGNSIILHPAVPAGTSFVWSTGATGPSITVSATGTYWITVNNEGCIGSDTIHITVSPVPPVDLGPDKDVCAGSPETLRSSDAYTSPSYLWNTGSTAATISTYSSGAYWLAVTVAGCKGADTVNVTFKPNPVVSIGNDTAICPGAVIKLGVSEPAGARYLWSTGSSTASIDVSTAGVYKLTVTLDSCSATDSIQITTLTKPAIYLGPDTVLCNGDVLQLSAGTDIALWSNGITGQTITITKAGTYFATVSGICGTASDTVNVSYELCDIWFPSAFTPNDDGRNDIFRAVGNFKNFTDYSLSIYNRWGQRIFYTEDIYDGWDGKFYSVKQGLGTYFYMAFYNFEGKKHIMKGDIELIR